MSLQKVIFPTTAEHAEKLSDALFDCGALSVSFEDATDQPILEPAPGAMPLWSTVTVSALFDHDFDWQTALNTGAPFWSSLLSAGWQASRLIDQDWVRLTHDQFQPIVIDRLCICPTWHTPPADKLTLLLDPGLAFGTGAHPTTALCLQWLQQVIKPNMTVIDFGCGSGILAIAAALLGAKTIYAVDHDPQALLSTVNNAEMNHCFSDAWHVVTAAELPKNLKADVLVANILANPLQILAPTFATYLPPGAPIGLSGILAEQINSVAAAYAPFFIMHQPVYQAEWGLLAGVKN